MRVVEKFSGCQVLSYCVMSNHFHILLEVPPRVAAVGDCILPFKPEDEPLPPRAFAAGATTLEEKLGAPGVSVTEEEFFSRLRELYSEPVVDAIRAEVADARLREHPEEVARIFARYTYRMHDLSEYMKTFTQRFSGWFNRTHDRKGRLWEQRFKSVIVEDGIAARTMAAYIDLNPVRAGIVVDAADYRWSSYGEAAVGGKKARAGLVKALRFESRASVEEQGGEQSRLTFKAAVRAWAQGGVGKEYRALLLGQGQKKVLEARVVKKGMSKERAEKELAALKARRNDLAIAKVIRHRVRYFSDGAVIGRKDFVEEVFAGCRSRFGPKRKTGARKPRGSLAPMEKTLWSARDLK